MFQVGDEASRNFRRHRVDGGGLRQPGLLGNVVGPLRRPAPNRKRTQRKKAGDLLRIGAQKIAYCFIFTRHT